MFSDYRDLLSILNEHHVKYLVIGAYAVAVHAQPRATKDLDILVRADPENAKAVFAALAKFGAPLQGLTPADFEELGSFFRMGREPMGIDILTYIPGVEFDAAWSRRIEAVLDEENDLPGAVISREDLLAAKRAAGRQQDLADIEAIEKADEAQKPEPLKKKPRNRATLTSEPDIEVLGDQQPSCNHRNGGAISRGSLEGRSMFFAGTRGIYR